MTKTTTQSLPITCNRSRSTCFHWIALVLLLAGATVFAAESSPAPAEAPADIVVESDADAPTWHVALSRQISLWSGGALDHNAIGGVRWVDLIISLAFLALAALADLILRLLVRVKTRRFAADEARLKHGREREIRRWIKDTLRAAVGPLALLIWIWALHGAAAVLLFSVRDTLEVGFRALEWVKDIGQIVTLLWFLHRASRVWEAQLKDAAARTASKWDDILVPLAGRAARLVLPLAGLILALPLLPLSGDSHETFRNGISLLLILSVGVILFQLVGDLQEIILNQYRIDVSDNLEARKVYTQVKVLRKVAVVIIAIFTVASMLMVFDSVRQLGASILASAGIAGIIIGFAAQRSLATLLAGFQIAITQPIRIDDVVIVENEWGRIEEITLTYVVVRIWDLRRLIVPINFFIERPFQNWTRVSADILAPIFLYVDYTAPLEPLRQEFTRLLENSKHWDRKVNVLQVTDSKEHTLEVRALASAIDGPSAWNLRCEVREGLVTFLQKNHPEGLPRMRAEVRRWKG
jgi:small-conductance mechanosensitive channel